ncbi:MAG: SH3 domain-containing protein [Candidatus Promineifilaceae bacterium]|nr:SH3 domain-containing protein [Candidatus Promineifilaceae bacterium]
MRTVVWIAVALWFLTLVACSQEEETPTPLPESEATATGEAAAPTATPTAVATATAVPTQTPAPTPVPEPTATLVPTPTPLQLTILDVTVTDAGSGEVVPGAVVRLSNESLGFDASFVTDASGEASFIGMEPTTTSVYTVRVSASGYRPHEMEVVLERGVTEVSVELESGVVGTTTTATNLRETPRFDAEVLAEIPEGEALPILEVSIDEEWVRVRTAEGQEGWVFVNLLEIEGDLAMAGEEPVTSTATPAATAVVTPTVTVTITVTATATATVAATATPAAEGGLPPRPAPVPFAAEAFRDSMVALRTTLEALGGYFDRVAAGGDPDCENFVDLYGSVNAITTYTDIPEDWQGLHELYVDVADDVLESNEDVYLTCVQGGDLSPLNRSRARTGINEALERLIPLIQLVDSRLEEEG